MARPVILFTNRWTDLPLEELARRASEWGYAGLELACWGDHCEVQRALSEDNYCQQQIDLLTRHDLMVPVVANHRVGTAIGDVIDQRHQSILPEYVWGDGEPSSVRQRAVEEMLGTVRVAQRLGASVVSGFTGSPIWSYVAGWPALSPTALRRALDEVGHSWQPILDACAETGLKFAAEIHPGQLAFDLYSAETVLDTFGPREEFGFTVDPAHLHWQGVDPAEFLRAFAERIYHVHIRDVTITLNGRSGLLNGYAGMNEARRGWSPRSPGHGGVDWEQFLRTLNDIGYEGPLSVDWSDPGMERDYGAEDARRFLERLDFPAPPRST